MWTYPSTSTYEKKTISDINLPWGSIISLVLGFHGFDPIKFVIDFGSFQNSPIKNFLSVSASY